MLPDEGRRPDARPQGSPPPRPTVPPPPAVPPQAAAVPPQPAAAPQVPGLPRCYRHPDHETGIGCTRCGRPICPLCMVSASVGFQCPECVRGGHQGVREARTRFGGRPVDDPALVTRILIGLNVAVFALVHLVGFSLVVRLGLVGRGWDQGQEIGVAAGPGQWYRLLTAVFLHWDWWHIGLNMLSLWWIGPQLEQVLGRLRYTALYLVSGLVGSALSFMVAGAGGFSLGASGAIFGLLGATVVLHRVNGYPLGPIVALVGFNLILTFSMTGIDWRAHVGGLVAGGLTALGMVRAPASRRGLVQSVSVGAMVLVALGLVVLGTAAING
ncbi:rhomboid family intramembrane serine protease [Peterkaempfera bronchialis]|uniref:Rhomboid family intramembrane serine protease n=1 Tax=Peterkaempfera bronchialis TaxID=2126346 RepID=A0A345SY31_9ACTN|nr:rhomboid family intramembrane serine protease [Peterkaempfera bronchialis]AXI78636.1 rhomboid family intramembrane serine protease [Peterkaempfera bronchialis]